MKNNIFVWALYDFAVAPLVVAIGGLYLAQWMVLDQGLHEIYYGGVFSLTTVLLIFTSPFFGAWSDQLGRRKPFLIWTTITLILSSILLGIAAVSSLPSSMKIFLVLLLFFIIQYTYQTGVMFYNTLIKSFATPKTLGKISGIGELFYEIGWLLGPFLLLPFSNKTITLFGEPGRGQIFFPAAVFLTIFGLPMLLFLKEKKGKTNGAPRFKTIYKTMINGFVTLWKENKNVLLFLTAFMLVADALLTQTLYFALYLDTLFHIGDFEKILIVLCFEIVTIVSTYVLGTLSDRYGTKLVLVISCVLLVFNFLTFALVNHITMMYICASFFGIGFAGFWTTSRALLLKISPKNRQAEYFGFYSVFQKFASILGPLLWSCITIAFQSYGPIKYRFAVLGLATLALIGTFCMMRVKEQQ